MSRQILNKTIRINDIDIFYREAGDKNNPSLLLLHGFPTSSVMFKNLITALSDKCHLVAPDYPAFGFSSCPDKNTFKYTFENISEYIYQFTQAIHLDTFTIYLHDYGSPVGLRLCVNHPEKIKGIIVQNGNAYMEGIGPQWNETRDYWQHPTEDKKEKVSAFISENGVKDQYYAGLPTDLHNRVSPETWMLDWHLMNKPGMKDIQFGLNCDYQHHLEMFPVFQEYFRTHQPPALIIWGRYDVFFDVKEASCYKRDLPGAQVHILVGGHMALETNFDEVLLLIDTFMSRLSAVRH